MNNTKKQNSFTPQLRWAWQQCKSFADAHSCAAFLLPFLLIVPFSLILTLPLSEDTYNLCSKLIQAFCVAGIGFGLMMASTMLSILLVMVAYSVFGSKKPKRPPV